MRRSLSLMIVWVLWGCAPAPEEPKEPAGVRVLEGNVEGERLLKKQIEAARGVGAKGLAVVGADVLSEGEQLGSFVEIAKHDCLLALASPGESVRDLDLFVYADDGARLAADEAPSGAAAAMVCPPHPTRVYVVARAMSGAGMVGVAVMNVAPNLADAVAAAVNVRGRPGEDTGKLAAWPGLETKIRERREGLGSRWEDVRRAVLPVHSRAATALSMVIDADRCLDVFVVPNEELPAVDAYLVDAEGRVVARSKPPQRDRGLVVCSTVRQSLTLLVRPRGGGGAVAVVISRSPQGARRELIGGAPLVGATPLGPLDEGIAASEERMEALALSQVSELFRAEATAARPLAREVRHEGGCSRYEVVGGEPLGHFDASLWGSEGALLIRARAGATAALSWCGPPLVARLEIRSLERAGPIAVLVGRTKDAPADFVSHPAAAARALARLEAAIGPTSPAAVEVEVLELSPDSRRGVELSLSSGCLDLAAAVAGIIQGLELRIEDEEGEEIHHARGHGVVGDRICAEASPKRLTLRSTRMPTKALLLLRR